MTSMARRLAVLAPLLASVAWATHPAGLEAAGPGVTPTYYIMAKKAIYREYTDATFATLKPRPTEWAHLGFLGPLVRAEVGDTITIVFRNNAKFAAAVHPHGVFYAKNSEGANYYTWAVPERAGPTAHEGSTAFWMYHSHNDEIRDVASGLIGPLIVTRKGMARPDGSPTKPGALEPPPDPTAIVPAYGAWFKETINGYSYGHTPGLTMKVGQRVRWYLMGSTNFEFHSPHWHGNVVDANHMRTDVGVLLPMGMQAFYTVER
jgi:FtsP/CotA-like multicopper oxidase with cupredoxin domain